jgi:hypothetical protein
MAKKPSFLINASSITRHRPISDNPIAWNKKKHKVFDYSIGNGTDGFDIT